MLCRAPRCRVGANNCYCSLQGGNLAGRSPFAIVVGHQPKCGLLLAQDVDLGQEKFVSTPFWELFEMPFAEAERPWEACQVRNNTLAPTLLLALTFTPSLTLTWTYF